MSFSTILFTEKGRALQSKAIAGAPLNFTKIQMGSGTLGGQSQITLNALIEPIVTLAITKIARTNDYATIRGNFSNADITTGFYWRELGIFATDPDLGEILYCYANAGTLAEYIPPQTYEIMEKVVSVSIIVGNAANVTATISESLIYASAADLEAVRIKMDDKINKASIKNNTTTEEAGFVLDARQGKVLEDQLIALNADLNAVVATGTGTAITLPISSMTSYINYRLINFIAKANNSGAATTININSLGAKNLYKPNTTVAPTLLAGKAYTVWYNGTSFFIKASAEGTTVAEHVLVGDTFSNDLDTGVMGTMPNRGAVVITPSTVNQSIQLGYHNGNGYVPGDPDLVPANIKAGKNIFGVDGNTNVIDTSGATATDADVLTGKTYCRNGVIGTGNIPTLQGDSDNQIVANNFFKGNYTAGDSTEYVYMEKSELYNHYANKIAYIRYPLASALSAIGGLKKVTITNTNSGFIDSGKINGTIGTGLSVIKYVTIKAYGGYGGYALITLTATDASGYYSASIDSSNVGHSGSISFSGGNITFNSIYQILFGAGNYAYAISETYPMTIEAYGY